jgi:prepilin-type processing-associated H-X9-DG protein
VYYPDSWTKVSEISDGTSKTLAVGERLYTILDWMDGVTWRLSPKVIYSDAAKNIRFPINADPNTYGYWEKDFQAPIGAPRIPLNDLYFASRHPGGAHFCMADSSVQFLSETIDLTVFQDLADRADP